MGETPGMVYLRVDFSQSGGLLTSKMSSLLLKKDGVKICDRTFHLKGEIRRNKKSMVPRKFNIAGQILFGFKV